MKNFSLPKLFLWLSFFFLPFTFIKLLYNFNLSDLLLIISLFSIITILLFEKRKIVDYFINDNTFFIPMVLFSSGFFISITNSLYPIESITAFMQIVFIFFVAYPIINILIKTDNFAQNILVTLSISSFMITLVLLLFFIMKIDVSLGLFLVEEGWRGRFSYGGMEPNVPARIILQTIPIFMILLFKVKNKLMKILLTLFAFLTLFAVFATASRSGLLTAIFGITLAVIFYKRMNPRTNIYKVLLILLVIILLFFTIFIMLSPDKDILSRAIERYSTIFNPSKSFSSRERIQIFISGLNYVTNNPIIGTGMGNSYLLTGRSIHNPILLVWVENGIFGLIGFLSIYLILIFYGFKCWVMKFYNNYLLMGLGIIMFMMIFGDMFMANSYKRVLWLPTLVFVAYANFLSKRKNV